MKKSSTQSPEVVDLIDAACDAEEMHAPGELDKWLEDDERRRRWAKEDGTPIDNEEAWFTANAKRIIRDLDSFTGDKRVEILGEELRAVAKAATLLTMEITKEGVGGRSPSEAATSEIPPVSEAGAPTICFNVEGDGDCYAVAFAHATGMDYPDAILVHGIPTLQIAPFVRYGHAWVEVGGIVVDCSNGLDVHMSRELYYALGKINSLECVRYTRHEAIGHALTTGHSGPWKDVPSE